jgi:hypothetical protein
MCTSSALTFRRAKVGPARISRILNGSRPTRGYIRQVRPPASNGKGARSHERLGWRSSWPHARRLGVATATTLLVMELANVSRRRIPLRTCSTLLRKPPSLWVGLRVLKVRRAPSSDPPFESDCPRAHIAVRGSHAHAMSWDTHVPMRRRCSRLGSGRRGQARGSKPWPIRTWAMRALPSSEGCV